LSNPDDLRATLHATRISDPAIGGVLARLAEVQSQGIMTGDAWPGSQRGQRRLPDEAPLVVTVQDP